MNHEAAFLEAILEDPGNDAPRLIFADYLEERGDPRGEFIRVQVELASKNDIRSFDSLSARNNSIILSISRHRSFLLGYIGTEKIVRKNIIGLFASSPRPCYLLHYQRGFINELSCTMADWETHGNEIVRATPLEKVTITDRQADSAACIAWAKTPSPRGRCPLPDLILTETENDSFEVSAVDAVGIPIGGFDAIFAATSDNPEVLTVDHRGGTTFEIRAVSPGRANVTFFATTVNSVSPGVTIPVTVSRSRVGLVVTQGECRLSAVQ